MERGANLDVQYHISVVPALNRSDYPRTPVEFAECKGYIDIIKLLFASSVERNSNAPCTCTALYLVYRNRHREVMELLLEKVIEDDDSTLTRYLTTACDSGHLDVVKLLLKRGANVNGLPDVHDTPLTNAVRHGYQLIVEILCQWVLM